MPTSIRLPSRLLARVDARAKALGVSRNHLLVSTIEAGLCDPVAWPPEFLVLLGTPLDAATAGTLDDTLRATRRLRRNRRTAPRL